MSMNIYKNISHIQHEYFALLDDHFTTEREMFKDVPYDDIERIKETALQIAGRAPIVTFEGRELPSTTYKAILLLREIHSFWREHQKDLYAAISEIPHLALHAKSSFVTLLDEVRSTALYVDTIVADDWLYSMREVTEDRKRPHQGDIGVLVLMEYFELQLLRKVCLADVVPPILIICPSPHYAEKELRKISNDISRWLGLQYANQLFGRDFAGIEEMIKFTSNITSDNKLAKSIADPTLIWEVGDSLEEKLKLKLAAAEGSIHNSGFPAELATYSPASALIVHEMSGFDVISQQGVDDEILGLEPRVPRYHWDGYLWTLKQTAKKQFGEETAVARILDEPNLSWLGNIPIDNLLEMRTRGTMEELRTIIRDANKRLKYASLSEFDSLAMEVKDTIQAALAKHQDDLKTKTTQARWGLARDVSLLTVMGGLSIASISVPWMAIPAGIIGSGFGLGSVRDVLKQTKVLQGIKTEARYRPIGMLWDAYTKRTP